MLSFLLARRVGARLRRLASAFLAATLASLISWPNAATGAPIGPTVQDVVEFTRIIQPRNQADDALQSQVSPNGEHAFIVTRRADVRSDRNRFEIVLLDVSPRRLADRRVAAPVRLVTVDAERDADYGDPSVQKARWAGDRTIVFRARFHDREFQVYRVEVATRRLAQLTFAPHGVVEFAVSSDLRRVVYLSPVPNPPVPSAARSVVVGTTSFWSMHFGQEGTRNQQRRYRYFTVEAGARQGARPLGDVFAESSQRPNADISPDGRWAVLPRYEPDRQLAWGLKYPQVAAAAAEYGPSRALDPLGYYSRPYAYVPRRLIAYRLSDGKAQAVLDAPDDSLGGNQGRTDRVWQGRGTSVVIAGTYLPRIGQGQEAVATSHLVEYWPDSGRWKDIAVLRDRLKEAVPISGERGGFIAIDGDERRQFARRSDGTWREMPEEDAPASAPNWRLRVEQSLNRPPDIVATSPAGDRVNLTHLNPQFSEATWGTIRPFAWKDAQGRPWEGGLMVPDNFDPKVRHALVIQTYGFSPTRFYLDGSNLVDGFTSGFAGRAFMRENILVLALPWSASSGVPTEPRARFTAFGDGVKAAIDALVASGSVDRDRIGIMGWSATGERVLNLVTFSDTPIRAASLLDGDANTLFSMTITYAVNDGIQSRKEATNGGGPFGDSLATWLRNDPSLHTDCIKAALRIETYGPEVHNNWDIYALLRRQYKPVEMIMMPRGAHSLSRPSERMASIQGNVDWYRFWLKGEQRSEPALPSETAASLNAQYARWTEMEELKRRADAAPRCASESNGW